MTVPCLSRFLPDARARRLAYAYSGRTPSVPRQVGDLLLGKVGGAQVEPMQQAGGYAVHRPSSRGYSVAKLVSRGPDCGLCGRRSPVERRWTRSHRPIRGLVHGVARTSWPPCPGLETSGRSRSPQSLALGRVNCHGSGVLRRRAVESARALASRWCARLQTQMREVISMTGVSRMTSKMLCRREAGGHDRLLMIGSESSQAPPQADLGLPAPASKSQLPGPAANSQSRPLPAVEANPRKRTVARHRGLELSAELRSGQLDARSPGTCGPRWC